MSSIFKILLLCFPGLLVAGELFSQKTKRQVDEPPVMSSGIRVIAKAYGDSIVLRWAPLRPWAWNKLNKLGYKIERIDVSEKDNPRREWLTTVPLKPYTLEKFKTSFSSSNSKAAIAAQCLYGTNFETNLRPGVAAIEDKAAVSDARYSYALMVADYDAGVAVAEALRFADKAVKKGAIYIYRIVPAAAATQGTIDTGTVMIKNVKTPDIAKPEIAEALALDGLSELHWNRAGTESWSGFYIERSDDGSTFKALNTLPYSTSRPDSTLVKEDSSKAKMFTRLETFHFYIDSLPMNYKNYSYRIRGINAFAELSEYSAIATVSGKDLTAPTAVNILNPQFVRDRKIKLLWNKSFIEKDCKGYFVTRSRNFSGPYEAINQQLLPPGSAEYTDDSAFAHGSTYYVIVAVDTAGNISSSSPAMGMVPDNTPPVKPRGLKGAIDAKGLVRLSWEGNKDEDIKGYKVYFANASDHVFTQVTTEHEPGNSFVDSITLKTLTKNIWYKIAAVDYNNNHSDFSEVVQLKKPDIVPPMPPIARDVTVGEKMVAMDWIQSSSDDAKSYIIYRRSGKNENAEIGRYSHTAGKESFHFADTTARFNMDYSYTAETIDEDGLHSVLSVPVVAKINTVPERPAIKTLKALYDAKTKMVQLNWQYEGNGDYFFILYRNSGGEPLQRRQSMNKDERGFIDYKIVPGKTYNYAIQVIYKDENGDSKIGELVAVTTQ